MYILFSSTVSMGEKFVSLFAVRTQAQEMGDLETLKKIENLYSDENLSTYTSARKKVQKSIGEMFGIDPNLLHLAQPTIFSR